MTRREARESLFKLVYQMSFKASEDHNSLYSNAVSEGLFEENEFIKNSYMGVLGNLDKIDTLICDNLKGWKLERISKISLALLRVATYEIVFSDVPDTVALNEAIELAKTYDNDKGPSFINGVLNSVMKSK